ncbi:putative two-component histidine kinase [Ilumatobacter coccineus YM16-304]|uniref:histidine kinase n=2 Tax=Ilumatobacter coccineus TaxID=467094 RepID=A0A6C7EDV8_ILUCY|nr:putative two-component histidine kinase [Ilumatobacter coccineus YM16-304]
MTSLWAEPAITERPARSWRDVALAALVALGSLAEAVFRTDLVWPVLGPVFGLALAYAVMVRRQHPLEVVVFGFGGMVVIDVATLIGGRDPFVLYSASVLLVLAFALFRWASATHAALGLIAMAASIASSSVVDYTGAGDIVGGAALLLFVAVLGSSIRYRRATRDQHVERAKSHERQQIARELHDTVAHHVSAISVQARAGLVEVDSGSLTGAAEALQVIADEATRTLTEMRSMVSVLRDDTTSANSDGQPRLAELELLAERSTAGTAVVVRVEGDASDVAPIVASALYRIAQESVTNALRHARNASLVTVALEATSRDVTLTVVDDGDTSSVSARSGYGLIGMSERVALLGGVLHAGPSAPGGWTVRAQLPR